MKCLVCGRNLRATFLSRIGLARRINRYRNLKTSTPGQSEFWERCIVESQRMYEAHLGEVGLNGRGHFCTAKCAIAFAEAHVDSIPLRARRIS